MLLHIRLTLSVCPAPDHHACCREAWIEAIQRVAENLQVIDESDLLPGVAQEMEQEQEIKKTKKKKVSTLSA